ncbi:hypothetical protein EJB05_25761 [Eragrostis curvula]|uniref:Uncharacterized protein n=1 Tax=Eragrostis curvula TaxID=38414 RepID=A0A5J9UJE1_9POAL|nr:hypothetical protein EJB05_25761 [Eragrostis curvula]
MEMVLQPRGSAAAAGASPATSPPRKMVKREAEDEEAAELQRGPWTADEDLTLINYITQHGDGRWNALARAAGLKRTGKSCRLRWLNYLRPDVKRGDFTADEQLLILDLHSRWGNRWSKIAAQLPGRTDNEIKNYWRTRVQKHARQLGCDVNSRRFKDAMAYLWMPRLAERASQSHHAAAPMVAAGNNTAPALPCAAASVIASGNNCLAKNNYYYEHSPGVSGSNCVVPSSSSSDSSLTSTDSTAAAHDEKSVQLQHGNGGDCWATTMQQGVEDHDEFWSAAAPALQQLVISNNDGGHRQFQDMQDLTGWVQGFCDGIVSDNNADDEQSLWSLDDIWRMQ